MKFLCKRGGSSGASSRGGGGSAAAAQQATTPSGVSYDQFLHMTDDEKYALMDKIVDDASIVVPDYLDDSPTSKIIYALGMNNKPTVVSDSALDKIAGSDIFRTVSDTDNPPPFAKDILDQIRTSDYTQLSNSGGSTHGRAIYFADDFWGSQKYAKDYHSLMMRAKVKPNAKVLPETTLKTMMDNDKSFNGSKFGTLTTDNIALYAFSHGIDGWKYTKGSTSYTMIINRGALTVSSTSKGLFDSSGMETDDWASSPNA